MALKVLVVGLIASVAGHGFVAAQLQNDCTPTTTTTSTLTSSPTTVVIATSTSTSTITSYTPSYVNGGPTGTETTYTTSYYSTLATETCSWGYGYDGSDESHYSRVNSSTWIYPTAPAAYGKRQVSASVTSSSLPEETGNVVLFSCLASENGTSGLFPTGYSFVPGPSGTTNPGGPITTTLSSTTRLVSTTLDGGTVAVVTEEYWETFTGGRITTVSSPLATSLIPPPATTGTSMSSSATGSMMVVPTTGMDGSVTAAGTLYLAPPSDGTTHTVVSTGNGHDTTYIAEDIYPVTTGGTSYRSTITGGAYIVNPVTSVSADSTTTTVLSTTLADGTQEYITELLCVSGSTTITQPMATLIIAPPTSTRTYTTSSTVDASGGPEYIAQSIYVTTLPDGTKFTITENIGTYDVAPRITSPAQVSSMMHPTTVTTTVVMPTTVSTTVVVPATISTTVLVPTTVSESISTTITQVSTYSTTVTQVSTYSTDVTHVSTYTTTESDISTVVSTVTSLPPCASPAVILATSTLSSTVTATSTTTSTQTITVTSPTPSTTYDGAVTVTSTTTSTTYTSTTTTLEEGKRIEPYTATVTAGYASKTEYPIFEAYSDQDFPYKDIVVPADDGSSDNINPCKCDGVTQCFNLAGSCRVYSGAFEDCASLCVAYNNKAGSEQCVGISYEGGLCFLKYLVPPYGGVLTTDSSNAPCGVVQTYETWTGRLLNDTVKSWPGEPANQIPAPAYVKW